MTTKPEETRVFSLDDATLIQRCDTLWGTLTRDMADLSYRNITALTLTNFKAEIDAFRLTDTDIEWQAILSVKVGKKDQSRAELHIKIGDIRNMAENVYGKGKGLYKTFGFTDLDRLDDANYSRAAYRVHRMATKLAGDLGIEGLTPAILADLFGAIEQFDEKIDEVDEMIEERDVATQTRVVAANALYRSAKKLAGVGKTHFLSRDEAKYNDYVLFPEPDTDPEEPEMDPQP